MKKFLVLGILICLGNPFAGAQEIDGYWKGTLTMRGCFPQNYIELQINGNSGFINGDSYHYGDIFNYVKKKFKGSYDPSSKRISIQEGIVSTFHIPPHCVVCVKNFDLMYSKNGDVEKLSGVWSGNVLNTMVDCRGGSIELSRIKESAFKEIPEIKVDTGVIRLDFYDNAEIDGDTISVTVNGKVVVSHQRLTADPITVYVKIDPRNIFQEVEMVGENLGSIPPNTALLIITANKKRHQLYLTSSDTKRAIIRIVYEQDQM